MKKFSVYISEKEERKIKVNFHIFSFKMKCKSHTIFVLRYKLLQIQCIQELE